MREPDPLQQCSAEVVECDEHTVLAGPASATRISIPMVSESLSPNIALLKPGPMSATR